jgi:hypothetical protein
MMPLEPVLTAHGLLTLRQTAEAPAFEPAWRVRLGKAFTPGSGHGLLWLGADEVATVLPPALSYWRQLGVRYVTALCALPGVGDSRTKPAVPTPADGELDMMAAAATAKRDGGQAALRFLFVAAAFAFFLVAGTASETFTRAMLLNDDANTSRCAVSQCASALPSLQPSATHK